MNSEKKIVKEEFSGENTKACMQESGMTDKVFQFPRGWSDEDKQKVATGT
jgi:hypothetical protein